MVLNIKNYNKGIEFACASTCWLLQFPYIMSPDDQMT